MTDSMRQPREENGRFTNISVSTLKAIMDERDTAHKREHEQIERALDKAQSLREDALKAAREVVDDKIKSLEDAVEKTLNDRLKPLEDFRSRAVGAGAALAILAGGLGALANRITGG